MKTLASLLGSLVAVTFTSALIGCEDRPMAGNDPVVEREVEVGDGESKIREERIAPDGERYEVKSETEVNR